MYLRNVKQVIRQVDAKFDERSYGFGNLADLLRAAGRDGIVRVDRDRQGVIRVFQGAAAPSAAPMTVPSGPAAAPANPNRPKIFDIEDEMAEIEAMRAANLAARGFRISVHDDAEESGGEDETGDSDRNETPRETLIAVDEATGSVTEYIVSEGPDGGDAEAADEAEEAANTAVAEERPARAARSSRGTKRAGATKAAAKPRRSKKS
jgi:hypothetical protein